MSDTWFTPPAIVEALGGASSFDLDPCSPAFRPFETAQAYYTEEENGLIRPWFGRVWLNPPYTLALLRRFLARMAGHDVGTALIFAKTDTDHFTRYVWGAASGILFLRGRLRFYLADGQPAPYEADAPSVLVAYGDEDRDRLAAAPIDGAFQALRLRANMLVRVLTGTWADALDAYMARHSGPVALGDLYRAFVDHPKTRANQHWRDKLRQVLQERGYRRVAKGVWQVPA